MSQPAGKPNSVRLRPSRLAAHPGYGETTIPLGRRLLDGLQRPTRWLRTGRPSIRRHPIWSCSVRGFACHRRYRRRGALLPHLFTLTLRLAPLAGSLRAVYFLCHCPSSCPARALPGALPCGVRTFLSPPHFAEAAKAGGRLADCDASIITVPFTASRFSLLGLCSDSGSAAAEAAALHQT